MADLDSTRQVAIGDKFGRWTICGSPRKSGSVYIAPCRCDCGRERDRRLSHLISGKSKSCGCLRYEQVRTHGGSGSRLYRVWSAIIARCTNPKQTGYENYGGKGISVCDEWRTFAPFQSWALSHGYRSDVKVWIDRIDYRGNYEPANCRFVDAFVSAQNTSSVRLVADDVRQIVALDRLMPHVRIAEKFGVDESTIYSIVTGRAWTNITGIVKHDRPKKKAVARKKAHTPRADSDREE